MIIIFLKNSALMSIGQNFLVALNILITLALLFIISLSYYFIHKFIQTKKSKIFPTKLAIRNIIIIVLCCVVLVVGVAHTMDFLHHRSTNVFEEMYNDYAFNHSELFSQIPIFYASDEFLWDGFSGVSQVAFDYKDSNSRQAYLEQTGIEIEAPLEENEHISIHLYEKPQQIVFLRQIITDTYVYTASYLYDCQSKTLTYTTSDPTMPKDTFLEDRILSAWFKYSHQDSPATCVVRQGKKPNYYTNFSLDNWGDVIIAK